MSDHGLSVGDVVETHHNRERDPVRLEVAGINDEDGVISFKPEEARTVGFSELERWSADTVAAFLDNGNVKLVEGVRNGDHGDEWRSTDELPGTPVAREVGVRLQIKTQEAQHGYKAEFEDAANLAGDMLNISRSASSLSPGATLEFGGDRRKRVTVLDQGESGTLLAVEIGHRD